MTSSIISSAASLTYFATEPHYLSLARRLIAALHVQRLALVFGDPPADPHSIAGALRQVTQGCRSVIEIDCGGEFGLEELSCANPNESAERVPPLFVFDKIDRLSDQQIVQICKVIAQEPGEGAAVVLARPDFLARLEKPPLQPVNEAFAARFRLDEIGEDESIDFLRHQLQARHRHDEPRGFPPVIFRASAALAAVAAIGLGAMLAVTHMDTTGPATGTVVATSPAPAGGPAAPAPADAAPPQPVAPVASPPPAVAPLTPAEIRALVARGDNFLKTGDIASARLYYERAADGGSGPAALRLGATFDPGFLTSAGVHGTPGDPARAALWYARALDLGEAAAAQRLKSLDNRAR